LIKTVAPSRIINCDETCWLLHPKDIITWAELECQAGQAKINGEAKECISAAACVTTARQKLPLVSIASGRTMRAEGSQIGAVEAHWRTLSGSGWQTSETFQSHLITIGAEMREWPIHLLLNSYSAHPTNAVRETTANLGITSHFIPLELTDEFQPLARFIFGVWKAHARRPFHERFRVNPCHIWLRFAMQPDGHHGFF
jgi:hypothetical protein